MKNVLASCLLALATCGSLSLAAEASAAQRAPASVVGADVAEGRALREKGDLEGARARFESAWKAGKTAIAGYELASVLRAQGRLNEAYDVLFQVAELSPVAPAEVAAQKEAARLFANVDAAIPMVLLDLDALAGEVAQVSIDGEPLPPAEWEEAQPLDPGRHEIVVLLRDGSGLKKAITVDEGARARLSFAPHEEGLASAPMPAPAPEASCPKGAVVRDMRCVRLRNYGWQLGIADGITSGLFVLGIATYPEPTYDEYGDEIGDEGPPAIMALGMFTYPFASPIVHWSHGHVGRGFASLGLHTAAWFGAIATIVELDGPQADSAAIATLGWTAIGFGLDYLLVPHIDEIPVATETASTVSLQSFGVTPIRGGAAASMQLTF